MAGYTTHIEKETRTNTDFRRVLYTGKHLQLVLMCLKPGEDISLEVHDHVDQFFRIDAGSGQVIIDGVTTVVTDGDAIIVPAGSQHNFVNTGTEDLKLYTIYAPANHPDGTIHATRQDALEAETDHH